MRGYRRLYTLTPGPNVIGNVGESSSLAGPKSHIWRLSLVQVPVGRAVLNGMCNNLLDSKSPLDGHFTS
jgi:hypothetical protein